MVVGDGANDLGDDRRTPDSASPITPSPRSPPRPRARIDHGDLTALLYAQGYRRDEFVEG